MYFITAFSLACDGDKIENADKKECTEYSAGKEAVGYDFRCLFDVAFHRSKVTGLIFCIFVEAKFFHNIFINFMVCIYDKNAYEPIDEMKRLCDLYLSENDKYRFDFEA